MGAWVVDLLKCKFTKCHSVTLQNRITALLRAVYLNEDDSISIIYMFVAVFGISCILIFHHIVLGLPTQHSLSLWHTHRHPSLLPRCIKSSNFVYCCVHVRIHVQHKLSFSKASLSNFYKGLSFRASFYSQKLEQNVCFTKVNLFFELVTVTQLARKSSTGAVHKDHISMFHFMNILIYAFQRIFKNKLYSSLYVTYKVGLWCMFLLTKTQKY